MKASEFVEALEKFFLDIIGVIVPGLAFALGVLWIWGSPLPAPPVLKFLTKPEAYWALLLIFSYVIGHALTSFGESVVIKAFDRVLPGLKKSRLGKLLPRSIISEEELITATKGDPIYGAFLRGVRKALPSFSEEDLAKMSLTSLRNVAMSLAPEQRHTVYRFMFISLLNLGMATSLLLLFFLLLFANVLQYMARPSGLQAPSLWFLIPMVLLIFPFLERRFHFYRIAIQIPFSMAVAQLGKGLSAPSKPDSNSLSQTGEHRTPAVYLAGGFQSGWQDRVKIAAPGLRYFDPRWHVLTEHNQYTFWDLEALRRCDWVFAYLEASNPAGYALALEVGFANALGKKIILVDEKSSIDAVAKRYLSMIAECSNVHFQRFEDGVEFLQKLQQVS
jgi:hypothetical protein